MLIGLLATQLSYHRVCHGTSPKGMGIIEAAYSAAQAMFPPDFDDGVDHDLVCCL